MVTTTAQFGDAPGYAEIGAAVPAVVFGGGDEICHVSSSREEKTGRLPQRGFIGYLRVIPTFLKSPGSGRPRCGAPVKVVLRPEFLLRR
jgi:hypothetical protein